MNKRLKIEKLENRIVLTAGTASMVGGQLEICGTTAADTIIVAELPNSYWVSATFLQANQVFPKSEVQSILIQGAEGNDTIVATSLNTTATIEGGAGDDRIFGSFVTDLIFGDAGDDLIFANGGNDSVSGGPGADRVFAGDGDDIINGGDGDDLIQGNDGEDTVRGDGGNDQLFGSGGVDLVQGGSGNDTLLGGAGNDMLFGNDGDDTVVGDGDHDQLFGEAGADTLLGGGGDDELNGGVGDDRLVGGNGDDQLNGGDNNDTIFGDAGSDELTGGNGSDQMFGGIGPDILLGNNGMDQLRGGRGSDVLSGQGDQDNLFGGDDKDILISGGMPDNIFSSVDSLNGDGNEDFLVLGSTSHEGNIDALRESIATWATNEDYDLRVSNLLAQFTASDLITAIIANGGNGRDAFYPSTSASVQDNQPNEVVVGESLIAIADTYNLAIADTLTTTTQNGIISNDMLVGGNATVSLVSDAAHGTITLNPDGTFSYTQTTHGRDHFIYQLDDGLGNTAMGRVDIVTAGIPALPDDVFLDLSSTGLEFFDFEVGDGASPSISNSVLIDYVGYLPNGNVFDSNDLITFPLSNLIAGFTEGVVGMNIGSTRRIVIPPNLGYGSGGNPGAGIGGTDSITFDVTLHGIV